MAKLRLPKIPEKPVPVAVAREEGRLTASGIYQMMKDRGKRDRASPSAEAYALAGLAG